VSEILTKAGLSTPRQKLVEAMQRIAFGRIEQLHIREGDPVFEPPPRLVQEIKISGDGEVQPEVAGSDFVLKKQIVELFQRLAQLRNGVIEAIEVRHGLPCRITLQREQ
jgi:hypothetical protein